MVKKIFVVMASVLFMYLHGGGIALENSQVKFDFSENGALKAMSCKRTGRSVTQKDPAAIWSLRLLEKSQTPFVELIGAFPAQFRLTRDAGQQILAISWDRIKAAGGTVKVVATVKLPDDRSIADWKIQVETSGAPAPWVQSVEFPRLEALESLGDDYLIYGEDLGRLVRSPETRMNLQELNNPGRWSMQFAAFFGSRNAGESKVPGRDFYVNGYMRGTFADDCGLFLAADDGENHFKSLRMRGAPLRKTFSMAAVHYPAFTHWPMSALPCPENFRYEMPYGIKLGAFAGGVGTATALYRDLVRGRPWLSRSELAKDRMEDGTFWAKFYFGADKAVPEILKLRQFLQIPVNTHWVRYGVYTFDSRNLHYLPSLAHFREGVEVLRRAGIGVAPYVCCAVWDRRTPSYGAMAAAAARDANGSPHTWILRGFPNSWMNPASPLWRGAYQDLTEKLFGQYGTNGQYLDVMACAGKLCYNSELHQPNGGSYWADGNIEMLRNMWPGLKRLSEDPFLCSEGFSENYIGLIDYFLMLDLTRYAWHGRQVNDAFPLFGFIYHDKAMVYGSDCSQQIPLEMLRWEMGLSFAWGVQLTYCSLVFNTPGGPHDLYTRDLAHAWYRVGSPYLGRGVRVECAEVENLAAVGDSALGVISRPHRVMLKGDHLGFPWVGPSVVSGAWRDASGNVALTMANITGAEQKISVVADTAKLGISDPTLWRSWPLPAEPLRKLRGREVLDIEVPADRAMILEIRGNTAPEVRPLQEVRYVPVVADKNGVFPDVDVKNGELFGCDSALALHRRGRISLRNTSGQALRVIPVNWPDREGKGGPRGELYRTFHLLDPTGITLSGDGTAAVMLDRGVTAATVDAGEKTVLRGGDNDVMFAVSAAGEVVASDKGTLALSPGRWRLCAYKAAADRPRPKDFSLRSLAALSELAADEAEKVLTGADGLPQLRRDRGMTLLAVANAITFAVTGERAEVKMPHDWLVLGCRTLWTTSSESGTLTLLNESRAGELMIEPVADGFALTAVMRKSAVNVFRLLYRRNLKIGDLRFASGTLCGVEVVEPLMIQTCGKDDSADIGAGMDACSVPVKVTNFAPVMLPLRFSVASDDGWMLQNAEKLPGTLAPGAVGTAKLKLRRPPGKSGASESRIKIMVNHTADPATAVGTEFTICSRQFRLKPFGTGVATPEWSRRIRHGATLAVQLREPAAVKVDVTTGWSRPAKVSWKLFDGDGRSVDSGEIGLEVEEVKTVNVAVDKPGTYILRVDGDFFKLRPVGVTHYAYSGFRNEPYHFFEDAMPLYFPTDPDAEAFEFRCTDGGPSEPGRVAVWGPDGTKRFEYSGNYEESRVFRIPVLPGERGKVWCVRVEPVQDFSLRFGSGVSGWFAPEREALLVPVDFKTE